MSSASMQNPDSHLEIIEKIEQAGLIPPRALTLAIIKQCNLNCKHCWLNCSPQIKAPLISANILKSVISEFHRMGGEQIWLAGGETLLHPDWFDILIFACSQPGFKDVRLQTNATLFNQHHFDQFTAINNPGFKLQISLDGASPHTHDFVRGKGSFDLTFNNLETLCQHGLADKVSIAFTEMQHNFQDIPDLMMLVESLGITSFVGNSLIKDGRAAESDEIQPPSVKQYQELIRTYQTDESFRSRYHRIGMISALEWFQNRKASFDNTCRCIETPFITAEGKMYPCVMFQHEGFAAPNVFSTSLSEIILQNLSNWSELPTMHQNRKISLKPCQNCPGKEHCGSGCMGRAYAASGKLLTVEDRCELRKAVYTWQD